MNTKSVLTQIEKAMQYLAEDQKAAIDLMKRSNIKKASDTICYRENTGALLYELQLQLLSEIDSEKPKSKLSAKRVKAIQKFQEFAGRKPKHPSWQYAYYSEEDKLYMLMCDYWMIITSNPDGLEVIGNPKDYKQIDWKKYADMEYSNSIELPNPEALELYIHQQKEILPDKIGKKQGVRYVFSNKIGMNAEWLLWAMDLTGTDTMYYNDTRKPCKLNGNGYKIILMPAAPVGEFDIIPTVLPKIASHKKLF